jgi:hypothetical protein
LLMYSATSSRSELIQACLNSAILIDLDIKADPTAAVAVTAAAATPPQIMLIAASGIKRAPVSAPWPDTYKHANLNLVGAPLARNSAMSHNLHYGKPGKGFVK